MTAYFGNGGECERTGAHRFLDPGEAEGGDPEASAAAGAAT